MPKSCFKTKAIADIKDHKQCGSFEYMILKKNDYVVKVHFFSLRLSSEDVNSIFSV